MARPLLPDDLWETIQPFLPPHRPHSKGGRPFLDDRKVLTGILFVLKTGIPWEYLPQEMHCGSGMTCWRRLRQWFLSGVWNDVHHLLLSTLRCAKILDFSRFLIDSSHVRALGAGAQSGPSPVDRRKPGSKIHLLVDGQGVPITCRLTAGNRNDVEEKKRFRWWTKCHPLLAKWDIPANARLACRGIAVMMTKATAKNCVVAGSPRS